MSEDKLRLRACFIGVVHGAGLSFPASKAQVVPIAGATFNASAFNILRNIPSSRGHYDRQGRNIVGSFVVKLTRATVDPRGLCRLCASPQIAWNCRRAIFVSALEHLGNDETDEQYQYVRSSASWHADCSWYSQGELLLKAAWRNSPWSLAFDAQSTKPSGWRGALWRSE